MKLGPRGKYVHNFSLEVISSIQRIKYAPSAITEEYILGPVSRDHLCGSAEPERLGHLWGQSMLTQCCSLLMRFYNEICHAGWLGPKQRKTSAYDNG